MKTLITAAEIMKAAEQKQSKFYVQEKSIITPAAKDAAQEFGVQLIYGKEPTVTDVESVAPPTLSISSGLEPNLLNTIIREVLSCLNFSNQPSGSIKDVDPSGLRIARGDSIVLEKFDTGNPAERVKMKELFNSKECSSMSAGFMTIESSFPTHIKSDELNYIIDGEMECIVNGTKYTAKQGDTIFVPADTRVTFTAKNCVRLFYVSSKK